MGLTWPLARWSKGRGVVAVTQRRAVLSSTRNGHAGAQAVTLGDLRKFVDSLEAWPSDARAETQSGAFMEVFFTTDAPSLIKGDE